MPKKRKTLKQKINKDLKRHVGPEITPPALSTPMQVTQVIKQETITTGTFTLPTLTDKQSSLSNSAKQGIEAVTVSTSEYGYLPTDLLRTAVISGAIIITEIFIRFFFVH
jgi:hypothetical protein